MTNTSEYLNMKELYHGYLNDIRDMNGSDSLSACQVEHTILEKLYELALNENRINEIDYIKARYNILSGKFEKFGVILKKLGEE